MEEYGPTETVDFQRCPTYWRFNKEWEEPGPWKPYKALGTAMAEGLAYYFKNPSDLITSFDKVTESVTKDYQDQEDYALEGLLALLQAGFMKVTETTAKQILANETVIDTELLIGHGRIDLITKQDDTLIVTDHKVSLKLEARYLQERLNEIDYSWQLFDYAWRVWHHFKNYRKLQIRYHIISLSPTVKATLESRPITNAEIVHWHTGAYGHWADMATYLDVPFSRLPMSWFNCKSRYGMCPAFKACHSLNRDEKAMTSFYKRKPIETSEIS